MTNISKFIDALKIAWVKRFLDDENKASWKTLLSNELFKIGGDWKWLCKPKCHTDFRYEKINNSFLCDVIKAWFKLKNMYDEKNDEVLWYNSSIKRVK